MDEIRMGIYRHYKGPLYQVIGLAHDANATELVDAGWVRRFLDAVHERVPDPHPLDERTVVIYIGLQLDAAQLGPRFAVRTLEDFTAWVVPGLNRTRSSVPVVHAASAWDEGWRPRFDYLGPVLTADMLPSA